MSNKIIPVFVPHRGCPNDCVFCNQKKITGKTNIVVNRDYVKSIVEEYLKTRSNYKELAFFGGSFTAIDIDLQNELLETANFYLKKGAFEGIRISTRPDCITPEILELQKKYGVKIIELGIQSLDDAVLEKSNRGHTVQHCIDASKMIKQFHFILGHQIMPGLPGSNFDKDIYTCLKSIEMKPNIVRIYPTLTIRDTQLECMYNNKTYNPLSVNDAVEVTAYIYSLYEAANVNVIRIGLQNTDTINEDHDVVAGPFHPAFRQLVEDRILLCSMVEKLKHITVPEYLTIQADKKLMSYVVGQHKCNTKFLKDKFNIKRIYLKECDEDVKNNSIYFYDSDREIANVNLNEIYNNYIALNKNVNVM